MKEEISFAISIIVPEKPEEKEEEKKEETKVETSDFVFVPPVQKEKPVELKKWIPDPIRATVSLVTETGNIKIAFSREVYIAIDEDGKLVAQSANRVLQEQSQPLKEDEQEEVYTEKQKQALANLLEIDFETDEEDARHTQLTNVTVIEATKWYIELKVSFGDPAAVTLDKNLPDSLIIKFDSDVFVD